jgi:lipoyl(octanoyl) transferase
MDPVLPDFVEPTLRAPRTIRLGRLSYPEGLRLQLEAREAVLAGGEDRCFLLEHDPVVTLGKRGGLVDEEALARLETPVIQTDRGGFATWHGPGQLVVYPIIDTLRARIGVRRLVRALGAIMQGIASDLGVSDVIYDDARPGIYRNGKKVGSLGLHLSRGVTMHGFALNICNDLHGFRAIVPCGHADLQVTTLALEAHGHQGHHGHAGPPAPPTMEAAYASAERRLLHLFEIG